ncbi:zincin [Neocallimastix californiae]|uniref:Zincin n=1 Tax=Neocallimastix californiae TaxID=1754190 RepID=A0A1Y2FME1_9FUNG|nr:zincin [Neocallimastix californiae]|eukprot:ORY84524.1 zincin [Neocallimastix californiae]
MNFKQVSIILSFLSFDLMVLSTPIKENDSKFVNISDKETVITPNVYNYEVYGEKEIVDSPINDSEIDFFKIPNIFSDEEDIGIPDINLQDEDFCESNKYFENSTNILNNINMSIDSCDLIFRNWEEILPDPLESKYSMNEKSNVNKYDDDNDETIFNQFKSIYNFWDTEIFNEKDNISIINLLIDIHNYNTDALFNIEVLVDSENPNINTFYLIQSGLSLPSKEYYENPEYILKYKEIVKNTFSNIFCDTRTESDIDSLAELAVEFEKKLAAINISTFKSSKIKNKINNDSIIIDATPQYMESLNKLLSDTDVETLSAYTELCIIRTYIGYVVNNIQLPIKTLKQLIEDVSIDSTKTENYIDIINNRMDLHSDKYNAKPIFNNKNNKSIKEIIKYIKEAMINKIQQMKWIENKPKYTTMEIIDTIVDKNNYSNYLSYLKKLNDKFEKLKFDSYNCYYSNSDKRINENFENKCKLIPIDFNSKYGMPLNSINFIENLFQPFFLNTNNSNLNYNSMDMEDHELLYAPKCSGKDGVFKAKNLNYWWLCSFIKNKKKIWQRVFDEYLYYIKNKECKKYINVSMIYFLFLTQLVTQSFLKKLIKYISESKK